MSVVGKILLFVILLQLCAGCDSVWFKTTKLHIFGDDRVWDEGFFGSQSLQVKVSDYDRGASFYGYNLVNVKEISTAYLVDMDGKVLHQWSLDEIPGEWDDVSLTKDGDLLVVAQDHYIARLDQDSNVKWLKLVRGHHRVLEAPNRNIITLTRVSRHIKYEDDNAVILADYVVELTPDGELLDQWDLYESMKEYIPSAQMDLAVSKTSRKDISKTRNLKTDWGKERVIRTNDYQDILHTNSVEVLRSAIVEGSTPGDFLLSFFRNHRVGILSRTTRKMIWLSEQEMFQQHSPTETGAGTVVVFDNGRTTSQVLEIDPKSQKIVWTWPQNRGPEFFSELRGSVERLPNGNTFFHATHMSTTYEVDPEGRVVWKMQTSNLGSDGKPWELLISRIYRLAPESVAPLLSRVGLSR